MATKLIGLQPKSHMAIMCVMQQFSLENRLEPKHKVILELTSAL